MNDGRIRIRRRRGKPRHLQFFVERMCNELLELWCGRRLDTAMDHPDRTIDPRQYLLFPYRHTLQNTVFQQDNAQPHNASFEEVEVNLLPCHPKL